MTVTTIEVEADSLEEAQRLIQEQIPEGQRLLSSNVVSDGRDELVSGRGQTLEEAWANAESKVPNEASIIKRDELKGPRREIISVEAFDQQTAEGLIKAKIGTPEIESIRVATAGSKGIFGMGKKPNRYEADAFFPAAVHLWYKKKVRISARVGDTKRSAQDIERLDRAERDNDPVSVICENCGTPLCKALGRPLDPNAIMVMTPEVAMIAARYCESCNIVVCGRCAGVTESLGMTIGERPCPRCRAETIYAAVPHLRLTETELR